MAIQFDPFSFGVATFALAVAVMQLYWNRPHRQDAVSCLTGPLVRSLADRLCSSVPTVMPDTRTFDCLNTESCPWVKHNIWSTLATPAITERVPDMCGEEWRRCIIPGLETVLSRFFLDFSFWLLCSYLMVS
jgi:hypothetical protein